MSLKSKLEGNMRSLLAKSSKKLLNKDGLRVLCFTSVIFFLFWVWSNKSNLCTSDEKNEIAAESTLITRQNDTNAVIKMSKRQIKKFECPSWEVLLPYDIVALRRLASSILLQIELLSQRRQSLDYLQN